MLANSVSGQRQLTTGTLLIPPNILDNDATDNSNLLQMRLFFFLQTLKPAVPLGILEFIFIDVDIWDVLHTFLLSGT